ncbi:MAG TPA: DUF4442 domain-containing protein [Puia sp.]|jgi:hypothetical protein|nr:DUF4442 domain-containing protein [Puia sp.]
MSSTPANSPVVTGGSAAFMRTIGNPFRFRLYLLAKIPSAFFSGLRIAQIDENRCTVTMPFKWFTKNPFRSTYFACLSMAAEMSTGALAMAQVYKRQPPISMLVVSMEANYFKKATGLTRFQCADGHMIRATIEQAIATGEGQTLRTHSIGVNADAEPVAEFFITWSFKEKKPYIHSNV